MDEKQTPMARYEADKMAFSQRLNADLDEMGWPVRGRIVRLKRTL